MKSSVAISGLKMTSLVVIWAGPKETLIEFLDRLSSRKKMIESSLSIWLARVAFPFLIYFCTKKLVDLVWNAYNTLFYLSETTK